MKLEDLGNNTETRKAIQALMHALYPEIISPIGLSDQEIRDGRARAEKLIRDIKQEKEGQEKEGQKKEGQEK